jgi:hypothetical protein
MIFQAGLVVSQDEFAIAHSNYAPSKTFLLNPTNTLDNRVWLDVHVLGAGTFVYNDYVFLKDTEFSFFSNVILGEEWPEYHYDPGLDKKSGYQDSDVQLISASIQYKEHGFAFATRARTYFDFRRITPESAQLLAQGTSSYTDYFDQIISAKKMFMNQMAYTEYAFSYSNMFYHFAHKSMGVGITAKYLVGVTGAGIRIDEAEFNIQNPIDADFLTFNGAVGYASPNSESGWTTGSGFAVDLGFVYKKTLHNVTHYQPYTEASACQPYDYKYKLTAAIIDLGYIGYNNNAIKYDIESSVNATTLTGNEFTFDGFGSFANNNFNTTESNSFTMLTPTALNLGLDVNYENYYYFSAQIMHGFFRRKSFGVKRPDVWALSGRYQRKWYEGSAVLSLYDYDNLRLGVAFRLGYLTFGTDKLFSFFGVRDFYGTDAYINLRFFLGKRPGCARKEKKGEKRNSADCVKN